MSCYFLDTGALAKLYVREAGTDELLKLVSRPEKPSFFILSLSRVELRAAVQRRVRERELSAENARSVITTFKEHLGSVYIVQPITEALLEKAEALIERHGLRTYDSIQLAACLTLPMTESEGRATFVCADQELLAAAEAEDWPVLNPAE